VRAHGLVLAAGQARRFGGDKLLAEYRGQPLLWHVLNAVAAGCQRELLGGGVVVVGEADGEAHRLCQAFGLEAVLNQSPHLGLAHSIQLGLAALERLNPNEAGAAVIFLADQPLVRLEVVNALIAAWRETGGSIIRPRYRRSPSIPGHPAVLDRSIWYLAGQLSADRSFAALLDSRSTPTITIDVPGDNPDVDTRSDLLALEESPQ
jgi:molybdenum cofactor cytidylyltransferase